MILRLLTLVLLGSGYAAYGQEGIAHPPSSELRAVSSTRGLCTGDNKDSMYYENYCLSIREQMAKPCTQEIIKDLYLKHSFKTGEGYKNKKGVAEGFDLRICQTEGGIEATRKSQQGFEQVLLEFFASLAIAESNQREYFNLDNFAKADNSGKRGGLFNLTEDMIKDEKYKCGCENINSTGQGKDLGPADGHLSATCATYIALYWAQKHGTLFGGQKKSASKNCNHSSNGEETDEGPMGAACIFPSLQEFDKDPNPNRTQNPNEDQANNPNLRFLKNKMKNYCEKNISPNGTITPWPDNRGPANR